MPNNEEWRERQPVRVLEHNVLASFEGKYPEFRGELESIEKRFGITRTIRYFCDQAPIRGHQGRWMTPCVKSDGGRGGQIEIHETFLSYIWALSYAFPVIFDEQIHGPHTGRQPAHGKPLGYFLPKAYALLNYGFGLITEFGDWPPDLPSPDTGNSDDAYYVGRASAIYLAAVDFILCHELAHVACGHLEQLVRRGESITPLEQKQFEHEADEWALDHVSKGIRPPERTLTAVGLGALTGLGALLFLSPRLSSQSHPDRNDRIRSILHGLPVDDRDNLWGIAAAFYIVWDRRFEVGLEFTGEYATYKELVQTIDSQLESKKLQTREYEQGRRMWLD